MLKRAVKEFLLIIIIQAMIVIKKLAQLVPPVGAITVVRRKLTMRDINVDNKEIADELLTVLNEFKDVVTLKNKSLGTCILQHKIRLKNENCIINKSLYRIPHKYQCELENIHKKNRIRGNH